MALLNFGAGGRLRIGMNNQKNPDRSRGRCKYWTVTQNVDVRLFVAYLVKLKDPFSNLAPTKSDACPVSFDRKTKSVKNQIVAKGWTTITDVNVVGLFF